MADTNVVDFLGRYLSSADWSIHFLGEITGSVSGLMLNGASPVMGSLFKIFNGVVLSIILVIITGTTALSLLATAQEGEIMGKKWSFIWVPLRAALGMFLLVPSSTGYSYIQITMLWVVLQGIAGANAIWGIILDNLEAGHSAIATATITPNVLSVNSNQELRAIFDSAICNAYLNAMINNVPPAAPVVAAFHHTPLERIPVGNYMTLFSSPSYASFYKTKYLETVAAGVNPVAAYNLPALQDLIPLSAFCGSIRLNIPPTNIGGTADYQTAAKNIITNNAITQLQIVLDNVQLIADVAVNNYLSNSNTYPQSLQNLRPSNMQPLMHNIAVAWSTFLGPISLPKDNTFAAIQQARSNGWINAGSYYYMLVLTNQSLQSYSDKVAKPTVTGPSAQIKTLLGDPFVTLLGTYPKSGKINSDAAWAALWQFDAAQTLYPANSLSGLPAMEGGSGYLKVILDTIGLGSTFSSLGDKFMHFLTQKTDNPLESMANFGQSILYIADFIFFAAAGAGALVVLGTAWMACSASPGLAVANTLKALITALTGVIILLFTVGTSLGIYLPLIPFLVYFATCLGWLIGVIEAIIAAPLIAIGLATPSEDEFGKAAHSMILVINLFLRPSLIVIGFAAAMRVFQITTSMLFFGFSATLSSVYSDFGPFTILAAIFIYSGVALVVTHRSFAVIHLVPDKIIRWIGGQGEESDADSFLQKVEGHSDKGAKAAGEAQAAISGRK
jgi:defect in organelle trafficking protein DotA